MFEIWSCDRRVYQALLNTGIWTSVRDEHDGHRLGRVAADAFGAAVPDEVVDFVAVCAKKIVRKFSGNCSPTLGTIVHFRVNVSPRSTLLTSFPSRSMLMRTVGLAASFGRFVVANVADCEGMSVLAVVGCRVTLVTFSVVTEETVVTLSLPLFPTARRFSSLTVASGFTT